MVTDLGKHLCELELLGIDLLRQLIEGVLPDATLPEPGRLLEGAGRALSRLDRRAVLTQLELVVLLFVLVHHVCTHLGSNLLHLEQTLVEALKSIHVGLALQLLFNPGHVRFFVDGIQ